MLPSDSDSAEIITAESCMGTTHGMPSFAPMDRTERLSAESVHQWLDNFSCCCYQAKHAPYKHCQDRSRQVEMPRHSHEICGQQDLHHVATFPSDGTDTASSQASLLVSNTWLQEPEQQWEARGGKGFVLPKPLDCLQIWIKQDLVGTVAGIWVCNRGSE